MELFTTHTAIKIKLIELINECARMQIAVTWANVNHELFYEFKKHKDKISKFVVDRLDLKTLNSR